MATIKDEIVAIATEQGYEGDAPQTIAEAVNALGSVMGGGGGGDLVAIAGFSGTGDEMCEKCEFSLETMGSSSFQRVQVPLVYDTPTTDAIVEGCIVTIAALTGEGFNTTAAKLVDNSVHYSWINATGASLSFGVFAYGYVVTDDGKFYLTFPSLPMSSDVEKLKDYIRQNITYIQIAILPKAFVDAISG